MDCHVAATNAAAEDEVLATRLWQVSADAVGLNPGLRLVTHPLEANWGD